MDVEDELVERSWSVNSIDVNSDMTSKDTSLIWFDFKVLCIGEMR